MSESEVAVIVDELCALGSGQTLGIFRRHGLEGEAFGVKYGDLEKLARRLRKQPHLADGLWASGNHDARVLACKIADPATISRKTFNAWVSEVNRILIADLSSLVARGPHAIPLAEAWTRPKQPELTRITGWFVIAALATRNHTLPRDWFESFLQRIEPEMETAPNRLRYALNEGLIAIGGRNDPKLRDAALKVAKRLGKVEVDHGETGCKTPDAASYIRKIWDRRKGSPSG